MFCTAGILSALDTASNKQLSKQELKEILHLLNAVSEYFDSLDNAKNQEKKGTMPNDSMPKGDYAK